jgi:saccharopine dehydrogenase (NADP+, L-glutamate forming)
MTRMLVIGAGLVAGPLVRYLHDQAGAGVVVADADAARAGALTAGRARAQAMTLAVEDPAALKAAVSAADLVVSMVPNTLHPVVAAAAIEAGRSMVTASYVGPAMKALDAKARARGVLILNELGLDPGIDHMEAMRVIDGIKSEGGRVLGFVSYCGGLPAPESNTNPFGYKFSWSPRGVLLASKSSARYVKDGSIHVVPPDRLFADPETVRIPGLGEFEGYPNRDSAAYKDIYGIPDARTVLRGTLRYPGWCRTLKAIADLGWLDETEQEWDLCTFRELTARLLGAGPRADAAAAAAARLGITSDSDVMGRLAWLGLFEDRLLPFRKGSALDVLTALMVERLRYDAGERDMIVLRHDFETETSAGRREVVRSTLIDFGEPGGDSSMSRTVGLPAGIGARLIAEGRISLTGVQVPVFPEIYNPILEELASQGIRFEETRRVL